MLERILLPRISKKKTAEGTVLRWHIEEGAPLHPGASLLTIQMGNEAIAVLFQKGGKGLILQGKAIAEGEHITVNDTLAFVGNTDEPFSHSTEKENVPVIGTAHYIRRLNIYRNIMGGMFLIMVVLVVFDSGFSMFTPMTGVALSIRTVVNLLTPLALTMGGLLFCLVCVAYLCQIPPEMRRVLSFRKEPEVND